MSLQSKVIPDDGVIPTAGKMKQGAELKTALAAGKMRLFKSTLPNIDGVTKATLEAQEADYDGYVAGGIAVAAVQDPFVDDNGSVLVLTPLVQFNFVSEDPTVSTNTIRGAWYEDAAGVVRGVILFDEVQDMETDDNSIPVVIAWRIGDLPE